MNNQKNRFWTFCFSLIPGAGEMYFGLYRQGISLMLCFFAALFIPVFLNLSVFCLLAVVLWFYSFLRVHNLRHLTPEEFALQEDKFLWENLNPNFHWDHTFKKVLAVVLILGGLFLLWDNVMDLLRDFIPLEWLNGLIHSISYRLPRIVLALIIVVLGLKLIGGKKKELEQEADEEETVTEYTDIPLFVPDTEEDDSHEDA